MSEEVSNYINVTERAAVLGCNIPTRIALLPRNFEDAGSREDLLHESSAPTVRILLRQAGISETPLELEGEKFPERSEKDFERWIAPIIFVSGAFLTQNPHAIALALGVISNYLTDFFKGIPSGKRVTLDVVVETSLKKYKKVHYEGPPEGLRELPSIIHEVHKHE